MGKKVRIKLKLLQEHKQRAGMGLPNWSLYYPAAALSWLKDWIISRNQRLLNLERDTVDLGWHAFGKARQERKFKN